MTTTTGPGRGLQPHHTPAYVASRPRLRGVIHLCMAPIAAVMAVALVADASTWGGRITGGIFGLLLVALYSVSGSYHVPAWTGRVRMLWGRVDTAMIVLFIAGTFTPIAFAALDGPWRLWSLVGAWGIAVGGAAIALSPLTAPRWLVSVGFLAMGWLAVVPMTRIAAALPFEGIVLIMAGGLIYTVGGVLYALQRPNPAPEWFGFHEIFHLLVVAASTCHYVAISRYVI
jgi:hemolysin III